DIVAVHKGNPVIIVDQQRKVLKGNIPLSTQRAASYFGNRAELSNFKTENLQLVSAMREEDATNAAPEATIGGYMELTATVTAAQHLTECYFALIPFDARFAEGLSETPNAEIRVQQLPDLKKDVPTA